MAARSLRTLCVATLAITFAPPANATDSFRDDFDLVPEGPVQGNWTVFRGEWLVLDLSLQTMFPGPGEDREPWIWAGSPPVELEEDFRLTLDVYHLVGVEGGVMLCATVPQSRWSPTMGGYTVDWNPTVAGALRLTRWDAGVPTVLHTGREGPPGLPPAMDWIIEVRGERITLWVGGELHWEVNDETYRGGHVGFWAAGQSHVGFDEVVVGPPLAQQRILRGDCNSDGTTSGVADAIVALSRTFLGAPVGCLAACDMDADGVPGSITDVLRLLMHNFAGGIPLPPPFPECDATAKDTDFVLGCETPSPTCH